MSTPLEAWLEKEKQGEKYQKRLDLVLAFLDCGGLGLILFPILVWWMTK